MMDGDGIWKSRILCKGAVSFTNPASGLMIQGLANRKGGLAHKLPFIASSGRSELSDERGWKEGACCLHTRLELAFPVSTLSLTLWAGGSQGELPGEGRRLFLGLVDWTTPNRNKNTSLPSPYSQKGMHGWTSGYCLKMAFKPRLLTQDYF